MSSSSTTWDDLAAEVRQCLTVLREREEYAAQAAALRRLRELAADAETALVHERFVPEESDERSSSYRGR